MNFLELLKNTDFDPVQMSILLVSTISACYLLWYNLFSHQKSKLPPGPSWLQGQTIGLKINLANMDYLNGRFGNIVSWSVRGSTVVLLNDLDAIKKTLVHTRANGQPLSGRVKNRIKNLFAGDRAGIGHSEGKAWITQRRFIMRTMHELGAGKDTMEEKILLEADWLIELIDEQIKLRGGQPFNPKVQLTRAVNNVVSNLVFGERFSQSIEFERLLAEWRVETAGNFAFAKFLRLWRGHGICEQFLLDKIKARRQQKVQGTKEYETVIDAYLAEIDTMKENNSPDAEYFTDRQMLRITDEIFTAGTESNVESVRWGLMLMALHPDVQDQLREEIFRVVGSGRPTFADRCKLKYADAVVSEIYRFSSLVLFTLRRCTEACTVDKYEIPKNAMVFSNLHGVSRDPKVWPDPQHFNVDNFWDSKTETVVRKDCVIPFSVGKRSCVAESLARQEIFVFFVRIMQNFRVSMACTSDKELFDFVHEDSGFSLPSNLPIKFTRVEV